MPADNLHQFQQAISAGRAAMQRGDLVDACQHLDDIEHPEALYLLAMARRDLGQTDAAELALRRTLVLQPKFIQASTALGRLLIDLERWDDAVPVYAALLQSAPDNLSARFGYATVQLGLGDCEGAEASFDALIREGNDRPAIRFMRARARLELGRVSEGLHDLQEAHNGQPSEYSLKALASTLWMRGDQVEFDTLLGDALKEPALLVTAAEILRQSGQPEQAIAAIDAARASEALQSDAFAVVTEAYLDLDQAVAAERAARDGLAVDPGNHSIRANLIAALLIQGKADAALEIVLEMRKLEPNGQHWIAYEATALRLLGDARYDALVDLDRFVRPFTLPVPDGFDSLDAFNVAFLQALEQWQPYERRPLDQSLRGGSQTSRDLTCIDDPVVNAYIKALDSPIRDYMRFVGASDTHPLTARNTGEYRIAGCWSVRLHGRGRHVNHVHPEGWISSAYYVAVPEEVEAGTGKAGWIKFGEPPFRSTPPTLPQKWLKPTAGMLVLFPSFLWHGTEAIGDDSVRVTAPFDVVPA